MALTYDYPFDPDAQNNTAASVCRLALEGGPAVLDLGSGPGVVSSYLQREHGRQVTCVDSDTEALEVAASRGVQRTVVADLEDPAWCQPLDGQQFDVVILADVLEHLYDPGRLLATIRERQLLSDGGFLVVSIPNAAHEAVVASLLTGDFTYQGSGLLDATHIRFFTRDTFTWLCESNGYLVTRLLRTVRTLEQTELSRLTPQVGETFRRELAQASADHRTYQYIVRCDAMTEATLLRAREALRTELVDQQQLVRQLEARLHDAEKELGGRRAETIRRAQDEAESLRSRLEVLRRERDREARHAQEARHRVDELQATETWRAGKALLWLPRRARRAVRRARRRKPARTASGRRGTDAHGYTLVEDTAVRTRYERALAQRTFTGAGRGVVFAVSTVDLDEGRGDVFTAVGLGRQLERLGYEAVYLPPESWYDIPDGAEVYVSLLAEPTAMVDALALPASLCRLAWVRNMTDAWAASPTLGVYDGVLCSSGATLRRLRTVYPGPTALLPIGVDAELFAGGEATDREGVAVTVNHWGGHRELLSWLAARRIDFPLALFGQQRGLPDGLAPYAVGPVSYFSLPSLYRAAGIVLDDVQDVNRPYGNVNSRIFESLACGALPVTNAQTGLSEVGLGSVPVATGARDLHDRVHRLLGDEGQRQEIVEPLRRTVLADHTYAQRAAAFDDFVAARLKESADRSQGDRLVIGFLPDYRHTNPFQSMLYARCGDQAMLPLPVDGPLSVVDSKAMEGVPFVLHIHWTATILGPARSRRDAAERRERFLAEVDVLRDRGGRVVWTVHNLMPHECAYPDEERLLRAGLAQRADAVHIMCPETVELAAPWFTVPEERAWVIPHGSYVDVYPNLVTREQARAELGLAEDERVFLFFGGIRPYKGLETLLAAFEQEARSRPTSRLVVAGAAGRFRAVTELEERCRRHPRITASFAAVEDVDVQVYLNACDVVVLPHRSVLNSGGLLLAWSFARPVIAPRAGCLTTMVHAPLGLLFEPGDEHSLADALRAADTLCSDDVRRACFERADAYPYTAMSSDFLSRVRQLVGEGSRA